jgi:hypothetical protein
VFASTEIAYDDGIPIATVIGTYLGVRFTPSGQVRVVGAKFYGRPYWETVSMTVYVTGADHKTVLLSIPASISDDGWHTITFSNGPIVSGDFYIAIFQSSKELVLSYDAANNYDRGYWGESLPGLTNPFTYGDMMIRALVESVGVGGVVVPTNSLAVLAPYLAMISLVAVVASVYVMERK